jgi:hypothetical protein
MPTPTACPISEVDRALSSYINPRDDTLKIRRTLSKYLTASLRPVNLATQNQHLNHECPNTVSAANTNPPGLKDSRLQYLQALRARNQAQARHRELQASLEQLHQRHVDENPTQPQSDYDTEPIRGYVSILRQRRRLAELKVIQESLEKLVNARPSDTSKDPKDLIQATLGEQPSLPAERLDQLSQPQDDQTWIFKLKQEVLEARTALDRANAARKKAQSELRGQPNLQQQVYALEHARDEIVEWVQGELAKMEEDSVFLEDASPIKHQPGATSEPAGLGDVEARIREAYDTYTASRASLIKSYESLQQQPEVSNEKSKVEEPSIQPAADPAKPSMPTVKLLPHLPHLTRTAINDRALLQQSVYLQAQIASADQEIQEALLRLSGESHLLPAGSKDVADWGKTAAEAEKATREFVEERLAASRQEMSNVGAVVELCALQSMVLGAG